MLNQDANIYHHLTFHLPKSYVIYFNIIYRHNNINHLIILYEKYYKYVNLKKKDRGLTGFLPSSLPDTSSATEKFGTRCWKQKTFTFRILLFRLADGLFYFNFFVWLFFKCILKLWNKEFPQCSKYTGVSWNDIAVRVIIVISQNEIYTYIFSIPVQVYPKKGVKCAVIHFEYNTVVNHHIYRNEAIEVVLTPSWTTHGADD